MDGDRAPPCGQSPDLGNPSTDLGTGTVPTLGPRSDWFTELFGFEEARYDATQQRLRVQPDKDRPGCFIIGGEGGRTYKVGRFATPSLQELEESACAEGALSALPGELRVRNVRGDVSEILGDPENRHATFQVASQFNCLEYPSPHRRPECGVTGYVDDRTQGPACCVACGPAAVYRNYFAEVDGKMGQRYNRQINNLREVSERLGNEPDGRFFTMEGGYTLATDEGLEALSARLDSMGKEEYQAIRSSLRVGVHEDVQVTSTHWGRRPLEDDKQTVTQVLGSACSVSYSNNREELWEPLARLVLSASYEATLWAALLAALRHGEEEGSRRVFLTCLGGGFFGNETRWITEAMHEAFSKFRHCGLEVCIVTHAGPFDSLLEQLEQEFSGK